MLTKTICGQISWRWIQKEFYRYFKQSFLDNRTVDVGANSNYVFALMFDLIRDFRKHRDEELIRQQLAALESAYPVIQRYTKENLVAAIEARPERSVNFLGGINTALNEAFTGVVDKLKLEYPDICAPQAESPDELESEENEVEFDNDGPDDDGDSNVEKF